MDMSMYPEHDDVIIVRRHRATPEHSVEDAWDVQTLSGEILAVQCPTREHADGEARRIARNREVSIFYEHDPSRADSVLEFVVTYRVSDAAPVA